MRTIEDIIEELNSLGIPEETTNEINKIVADSDKHCFDAENERDMMEVDVIKLQKRLFSYQEALISIAEKSKSITDIIKSLVEEDKKYEQG